MKTLLFVLPVLFFAALGVSTSQTTAGKPFKIVRLDPALDDIVAPGARLETLGERFGLTEGPVWVPDGRKGFLLFSDCAGNVIYKWMQDSPLSVFLEKAGTPETM